MKYKLNGAVTGYHFYSKAGILNIMINLDRNYIYSSTISSPDGLEYVFFNEYDENDRCSIEFIAETKQELNDMRLISFDLYDRGQFHIVFLPFKYIME